MAPANEAQFRPFELDLSVEVCDRASRLTKTLFGNVDAQIVLVRGDRAWRSRDPSGEHVVGPALRIAVSSGELLWIPDGRADERFASTKEVVGPPYARFYAAAPIRLDDGRIAGAISVWGPDPRPYDASLARRLMDLAAFVADDWARVQAGKAREDGERERDAAMAKLNAVVAAMPVSLVITDRDLTVVGCSPRWADEAGTTQDDAVGRTLAALYEAYWRSLREHFDSALGGESITIERVRLRSSTGAHRWMCAELAPWRTSDGAIAGVIISSHDITAMVDALDATERSEQRLMLALQIADIHVYEMDYARKELIKAGAEDTFFTEAATYEQLYQNIFCTVDHRDRERIEADWVAHRQTKAPFTPVFRTHRSDGAEVWASGSCLLVEDDAGRPRRLIGAIQNVTGRKRSEAALLQAKIEAESANQAKSTFLATMSHEIRTPLNGVLGMAQAMACDDLPLVQRERLDVIRESGESLLLILNDLLDLSKIEAGKLELEAVEFDIGELLKAVESVFRPLATRKGIDLVVETTVQAEGLYLGDSTRVRQILNNLISNALKFTEKGSVRVSVDRRTDDLVLTVTDTGIGLSAESVSKLFQKFEQADASTTRRFGGTGLGLAICRELAHSFGGDISAQSQPGEGTRFTCILPMDRLGDARRSYRPDIETNAPQPLNLNVLAAEDNSVNQLVLRTLLRQAGVDPVIVSDGAEAIAAWRAREWDIILMDVQMPNVDGPTATQTIRELEIKLGRVRTPIIALTANAMAHHVQEYLRAGMDGFVAKPIEVSRLFDAMDAALNAADAAQPIQAAAS